MKNNQDIRKCARDRGVFIYEVAESLGISEPTMTRWLRGKLSTERKTAILNAIDRVAAQHAARKAALQQPQNKSR